MEGLPLSIPTNQDLSSLSFPTALIGNLSWFFFGWILATNLRDDAWCVFRLDHILNFI